MLTKIMNHIVFLSHQNSLLLVPNPISYPTWATFILGHNREFIREANQLWNSNNNNNNKGKA